MTWIIFYFESTFQIAQLEEALAPSGVTDTPPYTPPRSGIRGWWSCQWPFQICHVTSTDFSSNKHVRMWIECQVMRSKFPAIRLTAQMIF